MTDLYKPRPERWPQFGLRGFFVLVTLAGVICWLGVQVKWIRDRNAAVNWTQAIHPTMAVSYDPGPPPWVFSITAAPWSIRMLGALGAWDIWVIEAYPEKDDYVDRASRARLLALFPEANVTFFRGGLPVEEIKRHR